MKRIIYTAVALIICASVFGLADYFSAKKQGKLVNYGDEGQTTAVVEKKTEAVTVATKETVATTTTVADKEVKKEMTAQKKSRAKTKTLRTVVPDVAINETKEPVAEKVDPVIIPESKGSDSVEVKEDKRSLREMFSRGALPEKKLKKK